MKLWRSKFLFLSGVALLVAAIPAASQDAPESLLPPGFGDPDQPLPPRADPVPAPPPQPGQPSAVPLPQPQLPRPGPDGLAQDPEQLVEDVLAQLEAQRPPELPEHARRPTDVVGVLTPGHWGVARDAFGRANGRFLSTLMRRLDAPVPSRWTSMLLRRALLSRLDAPPGVAPVDWVAERAWLLLRMGEADAARMLVQAVDVDQFTPKMFQIAVQTALATADPAALCPLVERGREVSDEQVWPLSEAMCAALEGDAARASSLIDRARRGPTQSIDLLLAEKVIGAVPNTRRAVTIEWDNVDAVNSWRFGLASATGLTVPDRLMDDAGSRMRAWQARAPMLPLEERLGAADVAASLGVFSNAALVEIYSLIADGTDPAELRESVGGRLRAAYVGDPQQRVSAMRSLWGDARTDEQRHARSILTAVAAARIQPSEQLSSDAADLIASMLSAGFDRQAARWADVVGALEGPGADRAWAMLALASERPGVAISAGRVSQFAERDDSPGRIRSRLLFAALAGLDRIPANAQGGLAEDLGVRLDTRNVWTVTLDRAAELGQEGTVALLAAVGMQAGDWRGVPPTHLYHILRALRRVGLDYEARMIAAEAQRRL